MEKILDFERLIRLRAKELLEGGPGSGPRPGGSHPHGGGGERTYSGSGGKKGFVTQAPKDALNSHGWVSGTSNPNMFTRTDAPNEKIEIVGKGQRFEHSIGGKMSTGGSIKHLTDFVRADSDVRKMK